jgi:hypothetical protein
MNENAKKWIKALRSGDYEQAKSYLHRRADHENPVDRFCCLGVACDLAVKDGVDIKKETWGSNNYAVVGYDGAQGTLPYKVIDWLGFSVKADGSGVINDDLTLASENDQGVSFDGIADLIEDHANILFKDNGS